mgnify:CR=1 FL=1
MGKPVATIFALKKFNIPDVTGINIDTPILFCCLKKQLLEKMTSVAVVCKISLAKSNVIIGEL